MPTTAQEVLIADAVVTELNDPLRPWAPLESAAVRTWGPWYDPESDQLGTLRLAVTPTAEPDLSAADRAGTRLFSYEVWLDFVKRVAAAGGTPDRTTIDGLCLLCQQVQDYFNVPAAHELTGLPDWHVVKAERELIFDESVLYSQGVFASAIKLTVRGFR